MAYRRIERPASTSPVDLLVVLLATCYMAAAHAAFTNRHMLGELEGSSQSVVPTEQVVNNGSAILAGGATHIHRVLQSQDAYTANTGPVCELQLPAQLTCPTGMVIRDIPFALYGRADGTSCPHSSISSTACSLHGFQASVRNACLGKGSCSVDKSITSGDPCFGTYKYMNISYMCVPVSTFVVRTTDAVCELSLPARMECPTGMVISDIPYAFYGRSDRSTCPHNAMKDTGCNLQGFQTMVKNACVGKSSCSVDKSTAGMSDPCFGTHKWMQVTYACSPASSISTRSTSPVCELSLPASLDCPTGMAIGHINNAFYGRSDGSTCPHRAMSNTGCSLGGFQSSVQGACGGRPSCSVDKNLAFRDPCEGTYKWMKFDYTCVSATWKQYYWDKYEIAMFGRGISEPIACADAGGVYSRGDNTAYPGCNQGWCCLHSSVQQPAWHRYTWSDTERAAFGRGYSEESVCQEAGGVYTRGNNAAYPGCGGGFCCMSASVDPGPPVFKHQVISDTQLWWFRASQDRAQGERTNKALYATISSQRPPSFAGLVINGDQTSYGHRDEWVKYDEIWRSKFVSSGLYYPGLGNHDITNNYNDCSFWGLFPPMGLPLCISGATCCTACMLAIQRIDLQSRVKGIKSISGAGQAYSWVKDGYRFIQLNMDPELDGVARINLFYPSYTQSRGPYVDWFEDQLRDAKASGEKVVIYMHYLDPKKQRSSNSRFATALRNYPVSLIFTGHMHECFGQQLTVEGVPVIYSGAAEYLSYVEVGYRMTSIDVNVSVARPNGQKKAIGGWRYTLDANGKVTNPNVGQPYMFSSSTMFDHEPNSGGGSFC